MGQDFKVSIQWKGSFPPVTSMMTSVMNMAAQEVRHEWAKLARSTLHSTAATYIKAIGEPVWEKKDTVSISLDINSDAGKFASMLENGCGPFDMKPGFLKSPKASKGYLTIPLSLKSTGSTGDSPPVMPSTIYKDAMRLKMGQSMTLSKNYEGYGLRTRLSADIKRWGHYTWKTSPFQGITKVPRWPNLIPLGLPRESAASYMTFRRVSRKSDPNSWIHPGFQAKNLMEKASAKLDDVFTKILDNVFSA